MGQPNKPKKPGFVAKRIGLDRINDQLNLLLRDVAALDQRIRQIDGKSDELDRSIKEIGRFERLRARLAHGLSRSESKPEKSEFANSLDLQESRRFRVSRIPYRVLDRLRIGLFLSVDWEIPQVLEGVKEGEGILELLSSTLTLVGSSTDYRAYTCKGYMSRWWPEAYSGILEEVANALDQLGSRQAIAFPSLNIPKTQSDRKHGVTMSAFYEKVEIRAWGSDDYLMAVVDSMTWLCAAVRKLPPKGIMLSDAGFGDDSHISLPPLRPFKEDLEGGGNCWTSLFRSATIVRSIPEPRIDAKGLELSFDDMIYMAGTMLQVTISGTTVLLGYSTLLIPIKRLDTGVQWHLEVWNDSNRDLYSILSSQKDRLSVSMDILREEVAFLGWDSSTVQVNVLLGTENATYSRRGSAAEPTRFWIPREEHREGAVQAGFKAVLLSWRIARHYNLFEPAIRFNDDNMFEAALISGRRNGAVLYDTGAKRAWLVPQASFLLHTVIALLKWESGKNQDDLPVPYAAVQPADAVILPRDTAIADQMPEAILRRHREALIMGIPLKRYVTALATVLNLTQNTLQNVKRQTRTIFGVEFNALMRVVDGAVVELKEAKIHETCGGWNHIVNTSWVIFCDSIGEAIRPADNVNGCPRVALPGGHDYLAATVPCLKHIAELQGADERSLTTLTRNPTRHRRERDKRNKRDCGRNGCKCIELAILSKENRQSDDVDDNSAVIFGEFED